MKKKKIKKIIQYISIIALFTFSFWYLFRDLDLNDFKEHFDDMKLGLLFVAVLLVYGQIFIQGLCYIIMGRGLGVKLTPFKASSYVSVDLFFSQLTPFAVGGQPMMIYEMKAKDNIDVSKTTPMVLMYSFMNKLALIVMAIIAAILYFKDFFSSHDNKIMIALLIFGVVSNVVIALMNIALLFMGGVVYKIGVRTIFWLYAHNMIKRPYTKIRSLRKTIKNYKESSIYFKKHLFVLFVVFVLCVLKRIVTFSVAYLVYKSFGLKGHSYIYILCAQTVYALVSDSFPIPGGIGAAEVSIKELYEGIYIGCSADVASLAAFLVRFISYYWLIMASGLWTMFVMFRNKRKEDIDTNEEFVE